MSGNIAHNRQPTFIDTIAQLEDTLDDLKSAQPMGEDITTPHANKTHTFVTVPVDTPFYLVFTANYQSSPWGTLYTQVNSDSISDPSLIKGITISASMNPRISSVDNKIYWYCTVSAPPELPSVPLDVLVYATDIGNITYQENL